MSDRDPIRLTMNAKKIQSTTRLRQPVLVGPHHAMADDVSAAFEALVEEGKVAIADATQRVLLLKLVNILENERGRLAHLDVAEKAMIGLAGCAGSVFQNARPLSASELHRIPQQILSFVFLTCCSCGITLCWFMYFVVARMLFF